TSLNLLFFYLTWSTLLLSHPPLRVEALGALFIRLIFYVLPSTLFLAFDLSVPSLSVEIKNQGNAALPGRYGNTRVAKLVGWSLFNVVLAVGLQTGIEWVMTDVLHFRSALRITTTLPMPWEMIKDVSKGLLLRGLLTYPLHALLHRPTNPLSHLHNNWSHSLKHPIPFSATYDHPLPHLLHRFLPLYLPALLFRFHVLTYDLLLALVSLEEAFVYSGYSVQPGMLLGGMARRADAHWGSGGKGNYGVWGVLDWVLGTVVGGGDVGEDVREEWKKRGGDEGVKGLMDGVGGKLKGAKSGNGKQKK
ncbi:hypothetical protein K490DRAFT_12300, partial [Saccharata proteae CBS 121410]